MAEDKLFLKPGEAEKLRDTFKDLARDLKNLAKESGAFSSVWDKIFDVQGQSMAALKASKDLQGNITKEAAATAEKKIKGFQATKMVVGQVEDLTSGLGKSVMAVKGFVNTLKAGLGPIGLMITILTAAVTIFIKMRKEVAEVKKDLGVSSLDALKIAGSFKALEFAGKTFGLEAADFKESFKAARQELGASVDESLALSFNLAKTAMETGTTAEQLTKVLSIMESVSGASRDALLAQIETNRQMIEAAGIAPGDVMKDIADNAEFFAKFAKAGSTNLIDAGIAARKLGLNMSAVVSITESLLDFETSIEKQMEASLLIGRQINLDRARQLAFAGDQAGMMEEILRAVGGEVEFSKMAFHQRKALADSVGVNVEQLSRLVRNNAAAGVAGVGGAVSAAMGDVQEKQLGALSSLNESMNEVVRYGKRTAENTD
jgi:hypothetical protein